MYASLLRFRCSHLTCISLSVISLNHSMSRPWRSGVTTLALNAAGLRVTSTQWVVKVISPTYYRRDTSILHLRSGVSSSYLWSALMHWAYNHIWLLDSGIINKLVKANYGNSVTTWANTLVSRIQVCVHYDVQKRYKWLKAWIHTERRI